MTIFLKTQFKYNVGDLCNVNKTKNKRTRFIVCKILGINK